MGTAKLQQTRILDAARQARVRRSRSPYQRLSATRVRELGAPAAASKLRPAARHQLRRGLAALAKPARELPKMGLVAMRAKPNRLHRYVGVLAQLIDRATKPNTLHSWVKAMPRSSPLSFDSAIAARAKIHKGLEICRVSRPSLTRPWSFHTVTEISEPPARRRTRVRAVACKESGCRMCRTASSCPALDAVCTRSGC